MKLIISDKSLSLQHGPDTKLIDLSSMKIAGCVGCFGCWTKTPGKCVIRDDAIKVYPLIAQSDQIIYVSRIRYGSYDTVMKTMLERAIPIQKAFIRILNGETHHFQRKVVPKHALIIAYGTDDPEEQALFRRLVERNAYNMCFESYRVVFTSESMIETILKKETEQWEKF